MHASVPAGSAMTNSAMESESLPTARLCTLRQNVRVGTQTRTASAPQAIPQQVGVTDCPPKGAKNLGNTCYLNATLQALFCCKQLQNFFLSGPVPEPLPLPGNSSADSKKVWLTYRILRNLVSLLCTCVLFS
jgi:hypothetical protein